MPLSSPPLVTIFRGSLHSEQANNSFYTYECTGDRFQVCSNRPKLDGILTFLAGLETQVGGQATRIPNSQCL
jgi:hypothetical protein